MRKLDDANLGGIGLFFHGSGNIVPINRVKYMWHTKLLLDDVGSNISAFCYEADLLLDGGGENPAVNYEGIRRRR